MGKQDWEKVKTDKAVEKKFRHKDKDLFVSMVKLYPSGLWNVEAYTKGNRVVFDKGLPTYDLTKKEALKRMVKYLMEN